MAWGAGLIDSCEARRRTSSRAAFSADGLCAGRRKTGSRLGDLASSPGAVDLPGSPDDPRPPPGRFLRAAPGLQTRSGANKWLGHGWGLKFPAPVRAGIWTPTARPLIFSPKIVWSPGAAPNTLRAWGGGHPGSPEAWQISRPGKLPGRPARRGLGRGPGKGPVCVLT